MAHVLELLPEGARIAVIRLRSMGDCVLTTPALALLKAHRPDVRIGVVVEERFRGVFEGNPDVDEILAPQVGAIAGWRPYLTLNLHGGTRSMWMTAASRATFRAGFGHHVHSFVYNVKIPRAQEILGVERPVHTAEHLASAMFFLGVPPVEIPRAKLSAGQSTEALPAQYAVLHPFASAPEKGWPMDRFVAVARHLRDRAGLVPVVLAGPADDASAWAEFRVYRNAPLSKVKSVMAGAQLFVGNDSGPAHIAAAFEVPVVVLFGPSNPETWAPWRTEAQVLRSARMDEIGVGAAIAAAENLRVRA